MTDQYDLWRQERKEPLPLERRADRPTDPKLMGGFWRIEGARTKHDTPVAIWTAEGADASVFQVGRKVMNTAEHGEEWQNFVTSTWLSCRATTKAEWAAALETGFWPKAEGETEPKPSRQMSADERLGISIEAGGNDAPKEEVLADQIAALAEKLAAAKEPITQDEANALSGDIDRMRALLKKATEVREEEYRPHKEAADGVSRKWAEIMAPGQSAGTVAEDRRKAFLKKEDARLAAEAAAENERRRKEAEAERIRLQREAEKKGLDPATVEPPKVELVEPERATAGSQFGRKSGLREYTVGKIVDAPALCNHFLHTEHPDADFMEYLQKRADAAAKAGNPLPGTEITKVKR